MEDDPQTTQRPVKDRNFYISGIYHPPPQPIDQIPPDQRWDVLHKDALKEINDQMVGKPILVDHPFDRNGVPILHEDYGSNYRGRIIHSEILDDGSGFFVARVPIRNNIKSRFFKRALKKGSFPELSMTHVFQGDISSGRGMYTPNHVALLGKNEARRPGCKIIEILKMPKKRHGNIKSDPYHYNLFKELKKNISEEKRQKILSIASISGMSTQQQQTDQGQPPVSDDVQEDTQSEEDLSQAAPAIVDQMIKNQDEWSRADLAHGFVSTKVENDLLKKKLAEFENSQKELRMKEIANLKNQQIDTYTDVHNIDYDVDAPITDEAKVKGKEKVSKILEEAEAGMDDPDPLVRRQHLFNAFGNMSKALSVASKTGAQRVSQQTQLIRENQTYHEQKISSFNSRFASKSSTRPKLPTLPATNSTPESSSGKYDLATEFKMLCKTPLGGGPKKVEKLYREETRFIDGFKSHQQAEYKKSPFAPRTMKK